MAELKLEKILKELHRVYMERIFVLFGEAKTRSDHFKSSGFPLLGQMGALLSWRLENL